ncbi:hypothetical protein RF103_01485, partial [Escherichia coli]|nr:hypothetical protein [Escherichia coli]
GVGTHEPHFLFFTGRYFINVRAATAATAVVYPHSTLAASVPAATPAPEIMPLTLKVNGKTEQLEVSETSRGTGGCEAAGDRQITL